MSDPVDPAFAQSWEMQAALDPETAEPLPLATHAPLMYVDDAAPLVLDPVTVVEMRAALRLIHREQQHAWRHDVSRRLRRLTLVQRLSEVRHALRLWRARHPVAGVLVHERTLILAPLIVVLGYGFIITATA